jgi:cytochrome c-type biogenesis protein
MTTCRLFSATRKRSEYRMTVFETARTGIESISWNKRVVLVLAASLVISLVAALSLASSGANDEFVDSTSVAESSNFLALAFLAFVAGALSFISPCTLPILPAYFAFTFQADRKRIATMTVAFFLGLALVFSLLGASSSVLGSLLSNNIILLTRVGGVLLIVFGIMSLFGRGFTGPTFQANRSATFGGSFLFGATFALGLTPCVGPILAGLLTIAAGQSVALGTSTLFVYALGLGLPLMLVSTFVGDRPRDSLIWQVLRGRGWHLTILGRALHLHSTSLISGLLFLALGFVMLQGKTVQSLLPREVVAWLTDVQLQLDTIQDKLLEVF